MSDVVIREVAKDVWIFSAPFARFGMIPVGGRSTAIRMTDGGVWVMASTPLTPETKAKLSEIGPVKYIVGPDAVHHLYLGEFKRAYPEAKLLSVQAAIEKNKEGLSWAGSWGKDAPGTKYGFEQDVQHCYFSGFTNKDVAFFHAASKSLIVADLLFNLPPREQYSKSGSISQIFGFSSMLTPFSWAHRKFAWSQGTDKEAMRRDAKTVAAWDFERIIPCHGDVIEKEGKRAWEAAYADYLT